MRNLSEKPSGHNGSPCVRNCCLDSEDICIGCHRSLQEILAWHSANNDDRCTILALCQERKKARSDR